MRQIHLSPLQSHSYTVLYSNQPRTTQKPPPIHSSLDNIVGVDVMSVGTAYLPLRHSFSIIEYWISASEGDTECGTKDFDYPFMSSWKLQQVSCRSAKMSTNYL